MLENGHLSRRARYFTPAEANRLLAEIIPVVEKAKTVLDLSRSLIAENRHEEVEQLYAQVRGMLRGIRDQGIEVKGLDPALLDFPALRYGKEVYLCWKEGEEEITSWHPISTGFAGRQPLAATERGAWEWCN